MKKTIFETIIFIKDVDCKKIVGERESYRPSFESNLPTTLQTNFHLRQDSLQYLTDVIMECMGELKDPIESIAYEVIWRNKYSKRSDFQGYHTHSHTHWSFIVYETVEKSRTQFIHPSMAVMHNQLATNNSKDFRTTFSPTLKPGTMLLFPSWLPHQVLPGNIGTTLSGNFWCNLRKD